MSRRSDHLTLAAAGAFALVAVAFAVIALIADRPLPADVRLTRLALPAAIAVPAALGLLARRSRPTLLIAGAILAAAMSMLSIALLPLLIPAALYVRAAAVERWSGSAPPLRAAAAAVVTVALGLAAIGSAGFVRADRCWSWTVSADGTTTLEDVAPAGTAEEGVVSPGASSGTTCGDEVTPAGAAGGLALAALAVVVGGLLSRPIKSTASWPSSCVVSTAVVLALTGCIAADGSGHQAGPRSQGPNAHAVDWRVLPEPDLTDEGYRYGHSAAWVFDHMIVWGGREASGETQGDVKADGAVFDAVRSSWDDMPQSPLEAREFHSAVPIGDQIIIWGGRSDPSDACCDGVAFSDGAIFEAAANTWTPLPAAPRPGRYLHTALATDEEMIVLGGFPDASPDPGEEFPPGLSDLPAIAYRLETGTWRKLPTAPVPLVGEFSAVWTGHEVVVWGESDDMGVPRPTSDTGAAYDPVQDGWRLLEEPPLRPLSRHELFWTGRHVVVWDPRTTAGALHDIESGEWLPIPSAVQSPLDGASAGFVDGHLLIWGIHTSEDPTERAYSYDISSMRWTEIRPSPLSARHGHSIVVADRTLYLWGGRPLDEAADYVEFVSVQPDGT